MKSLETQHPFMLTLTGLTVELHKVSHVDSQIRDSAGSPCWRLGFLLGKKQVGWEAKDDGETKGGGLDSSWFGWKGMDRFVRMQIEGVFWKVLILENGHRVLLRCMYVILVQDLDNLIVWKYGSTRLSMTSESITWCLQVEFYPTTYRSTIFPCDYELIPRILCGP